MTINMVPLGAGRSHAGELTPDPVPAHNVLQLIRGLRLTPPRLILSPPTQPRRASVALIMRMKPAPELVFEGHVPAGYGGPVVPAEDFGVGLPPDEFLRLRRLDGSPLTCSVGEPPRDCAGAAVHPAGASRRRQLTLVEPHCIPRRTAGAVRRLGSVHCTA